MGPRSARGVAWRQIRLTTAVMAALLVVIVTVAVATYNISGGAIALTGVSALLRNPAFRALYGDFTALDTAGAYVLWKVGIVVTLAVAIWAALGATRVTRGAEDTGTWDLLVIERVSRATVYRETVGVLALSGVAVGLVVFAALVANGQRPLDSALYGAGLTGLAWCAQATGLVASELLAPRRSATQMALGAIGVGYLARMVADASTNGSWLTSLTPFGWLERVGAFQHHEAGWLVPLLVTPVLVVAVLAPMAGRRDVGSAWWRRTDRGTVRPALLASPWRFAWRELASTLVVWLVVTGVVGLVIGYLTNALVTFGRTDRSFARLLARWHLGQLVSVRGYVGEIGTFLALGLGFFVVSVVATVGADAVSGRLELPLGNGAGRRAWLGSTSIVAGVGAVLVAVVTAVGIWVGVGSGGSSLSLPTALAATTNALTEVPLVLGVAALAVALVPRLVQVTLSGLLALSYLDAVLGPPLHWPAAVVDVSIYHYARLVPAVAPDWGTVAGFVIVGTIALAAAIGWFARRDLAG